MVSNYKYLGTMIDNQLKFDANTEMLCKKGQQRLFCLRKLAKFQVDKTLMSLFYRSYIESVLSFSIVCWYGNLGLQHRNSLDKIVRLAGKIAGVSFPSLNSIFTKQVLTKARCIMSDDAHPLRAKYQLLHSGVRLRSIKGKKRYFSSFVPTSIRALNATGRFKT